MDVNSAGRAAKALLDAYASRISVPPLTTSDPGLSLDDAYVIRLAQVATWTSSGAVAPGHLLVKLPRSDVIEVTSAKAVAERDRAEG